MTVYANIERMINNAVYLDSFVSLFGSPQSLTEGKPQAPPQMVSDSKPRPPWRGLFLCLRPCQVSDVARGAADLSPLREGINITKTAHFLSGFFVVFSPIFCRSNFGGQIFGFLAVRLRQRTVIKKRRDFVGRFCPIVRHYRLDFDGFFVCDPSDT